MQVAGQEGRYLAKLLSKHQIQAGQPLPPEAQPFRYAQVSNFLKLALSTQHEPEQLVYIYGYF